MLVKLRLMRKRMALRIKSLVNNFGFFAKKKIFFFIQNNHRRRVPLLRPALLLPLLELCLGKRVVLHTDRLVN